MTDKASTTAPNSYKFNRACSCRLHQQPWWYWLLIVCDRCCILLANSGNIRVKHWYSHLYLSHQTTHFSIWRYICIHKFFFLYFFWLYISSWQPPRRMSFVQLFDSVQCAVCICLVMCGNMSFLTGNWYKYCFDLGIVMLKS